MNTLGRSLTQSGGKSIGCDEGLASGLGWNSGLDDDDLPDPLWVQRSHSFCASLSKT